ncbi:MAG: alpha/beta fold hydrolase [Solirubrobacteraceae bacterium]|nr:alpha/beta fold hydrolase [Solirubrobacteraceae bacterium]
MSVAALFYAQEVVFNPFVPSQLGAAAANLYDVTVTGHLADTRPQARRIITEARHRTVYRYLETVDPDPDRLPVLLIPTLGAPPACFDLRHGNSMVEHLLGVGVRTYMVDFGRQKFSDRDLALERWVELVLPRTIREVSADAGDRPVHLVGWSLGGVLAALTVANDNNLPVHTVSVIAAPFDLHRMRLRGTLATFSALTDLSEGFMQSALTRVMTNPVAAPFVRTGLRLASIPRDLRGPLVKLANLHDREALAQIEATDAIKGELRTYTGRSIGEIYARFIAVNELDRRPAELHGEFLDIGDLRQPFLAIAGGDDILAPEVGVHTVGTLLPQSAEVRLRTSPGGHLAVLSGPHAAETTWREIDEFQRWWDLRAIRRRVPSRRVSVEAAGSQPERPRLQVV